MKGYSIGGYTDYDSKWEDYKSRSASDLLDEVTEERDMFQDIAYAAMKALDEDGRADFLLLKNAKVREWWTAIKEEERKQQVIKDALAKLNDEEKQLLGLD